MVPEAYPVGPWADPGVFSPAHQPGLQPAGVSDVPEAGPHLRLGWFLLICQLVWWVLRGEPMPNFSLGTGWPWCLPWWWASTWSSWCPQSWSSLEIGLVPPYLSTCLVSFKGEPMPNFPWGLAGPLTLMFNFTRVIKVSQEDKAQLSGFLLGSSTRHTRQSKAIPWDSSPSSLLSYSFLASDLDLWTLWHSHTLVSL